MVAKLRWCPRSLVRAVARAGAVLAVALVAGGRPHAAEEGGAGAIAIGVAGPMTGQYQAFGEQLRQGAALAVARLNAAGGVLGRRLRLTVLDDRCDPAEAARVAREAARLGLSFVAGHFCSSASLAAAPIYQDGGVLMVTPASSNPLLTERGDPLVFRVVGRDDRQARFAADYVLERLPGRRIAVLDDGSAYGAQLAQAFAARLRGGGVAPVERLRLARGEPAYPGIVDRLRRARAELLYFGGYHPEAAAVLRGARAAGLELRLVGGDALATDQFWDQAGGAAQGTLFTTSPDPRANPAARQVVAAFRDRGVEPEGYVLPAYAAVQVWAAAAERARDARPAPVAAALRTGRYPTALGGLAFDRKGDLRGNPFVMLRWRDGRRVPAGG